MIPIYAEGIFCDVCGKDMTYHQEQNETLGWSGETSYIGVQISVSSEIPEMKEFFQKQLGPYELNKQYNICYECWLKSLGVPIPEKRNQNAPTQRP
jgi:hypothetical protein